MTPEILARQIAWSRATFGMGGRTGGVTAHILKELLEVRAHPSLEEWVDVIILGVDGAHRFIDADGDLTPEDAVKVLTSSYAFKVGKNAARNFARPKDEDTPSEAGDTAGEIRWKPGNVAFEILARRKRHVEQGGAIPENDDRVGVHGLVDAAAKYLGKQVQRDELLVAISLLWGAIEAMDRQTHGGNR